MIEANHPYRCAALDKKVLSNPWHCPDLYTHLGVSNLGSQVAGTYLKLVEIKCVLFKKLVKNRFAARAAPRMSDKITDEFDGADLNDRRLSQRLRTCLDSLTSPLY